MSITKEQLREYLFENWNIHFFEALVKCLKEELFNFKTEEDRKNWIFEIKSLITDGVCDGVKSFLEENCEDLIDHVSKEFVDSLNISLEVTKKEN